MEKLYRLCVVTVLAFALSKSCIYVTTSSGYEYEIGDSSVFGSIYDQAISDIYYDLKLAYNLGDPKRMDMLGNRFNLTGDYAISDELSLGGVIRMDYDAAYMDNSKDELKSARLRSFFVSYKKNDILLRVGKQQIAWGIADKYKLLDKINPFDLQKFVLEEDQDYRIPVYSSQIIAQNGYAGSIELVVLPRYKRSSLAMPGSTFEIGSAPTIPVARADDPAITVANMEYGLKWNRFITPVDISIAFFRGFEDIPAVEKKLSQTGISLSERLYKTNTVGGLVSFPFFNVILNGELAYTYNKQFDSTDILIRHGLAVSDQLQFLLSMMLETEFVDMNFQYYNDWITENKKIILRDDKNGSCSLLLSKAILDDTVKLSILTIYGATDRDWFVHPRLKYLLSDDIQLSLGFYLFAGD